MSSSQQGASIAYDADDVLALLFAHYDRTGFGVPTIGCGLSQPPADQDHEASLPALYAWTDAAGEAHVDVCRSELVHLCARLAFRAGHPVAAHDARVSIAVTRFSVAVRAAFASAKSVPGTGRSAAAGRSNVIRLAARAG